MDGCSVTSYRAIHSNTELCVQPTVAVSGSDAYP
jgi:hypothetical protein